MQGARPLRAVFQVLDYLLEERGTHRGAGWEDTEIDVFPPEIYEIWTAIYDKSNSKMSANVQVTKIIAARGRAYKLSRIKLLQVQ